MALGLVRAATVADVQPAAILAAEALGSTHIVDPTLIGKLSMPSVEGKAIASKTSNGNSESLPEARIRSSQVHSFYSMLSLDVLFEAAFGST